MSCSHYLELNMEWKGGFFWIVSNDVDKFELPFKVEGM
jgi:hypothetical protein